MKLIKIVVFMGLLLCELNAIAQTESERLNLPGDNLNLYAVMKLFQESPTLEGFERKLNDPSSKINNLDLNADNKVDYIRVADHPEGAIHNITLKVPISGNEEQDVAVFVVEKLADDKVQIQLIGDEDLYGKDYIIEPNMNDDATAAGETANPGYTINAILGNGETVAVQQTTPGQIATWPVVRFIYVPTYTLWNSPWYWDHYPSYWLPWEPFYWHYYYGYHFHWEHYYYGHYRRCSRYRVHGWRDRYYTSHQHSASPYVKDRYRKGAYNHTYSKPQLASAGSDQFKTENPQSPYVNSKLPIFDQAGTPVRKPQVVRPVEKETITPIKDEAGNPVKQQPTRAPAQLETVTPNKDEPVKPVVQQPTKAPVKYETPAPTKNEPIKPVRQQPTTPPVKQESVPHRDVPIRTKPTKRVTESVTPVKPAETKPVKKVKTTSAD